MVKGTIKKWNGYKPFIMLFTAILVISLVVPAFAETSQAEDQNFVLPDTEWLQSVMDTIDALPQESEIDGMDVIEATALIWQFSDILETIEQYETRSAEAIEVAAAEQLQSKIERMNELLDHLRYNYLGIDFDSQGMIAASGNHSGLTALDISIGRIVIDDDRWTQYVGISNTILSSGAANPEGYLLSGVVTKDQASLDADSGYILVSPGSTAALYLNGVELSTNMGLSCILVTKANVTITLIDGTDNQLTCYNDKTGRDIYTTYRGGALVKNGMDDYTLTIECEHADEPGHMCAEGQCGRLTALAAGDETAHIAAIGSDVYATRFNAQGGFSNLYITGGIVIAQAGVHTPGIGSMCGNTYFPSEEYPQIYETATNPAQYCSNINISGGRVYAYGGDGCAGIGSGWAGPVDGIYISDGAYVYAEGGAYSPGIGSGGVVDNSPRPTAAGIYNVSNIIISGGMTVVEAVGDASGVFGSPIMAGIGTGISYLGESGTITNVVASPDDSWYAMVKQGTSVELVDATYTDESPADYEIEIKNDQSYYYTLVYFINKVQLNASVNGQKQDNGSHDAPILVKPGDVVTYTLTAESSSADAMAIYILEDQIPAGMSLVTTADSYTPGMTYTTVDGVTTVKWSGLTGTQSVFFTVTVNPLSAETMQADYLNQGMKVYTLDTENEAVNKVMYSNFAYHRAEIEPEPEETETETESEQTETDNSTDIELEETERTEDSEEVDTNIDPEVDNASVTAVKSAAINGKTSSDAVPIVQAGDQIRYSIAVTNSGSKPAKNIQVRDYIPVGTTYLADTADSSSGDPGIITVLAGEEEDKSRIDWLLAEIPAGQTVTVYFTVTVNPLAASDDAILIKNEGLFKYSPDGSMSDDNKLEDQDSSDEGFIKTNAVLCQQSVFIKYATASGTTDANDQGALKPGQYVTYTMQLYSAAELGQVTVSDQIPAGMLFGNGSISYTYINHQGVPVTMKVDDAAFDSITRTITWPLVDVQAGVIKFEFCAVVDGLPAGIFNRIFDNQAVLTFTESGKEPLLSNVVSHTTSRGKSEVHKSSTTYIINENGEEIVDQIGVGSKNQPIPVNVSQVIEYKLTVVRTDDSNNHSGEVVVTDIIPQGTTLIPDSINATVTNAIDGSTIVIKSMEYKLIEDQDGTLKPGLEWVLTGLSDTETVELTFRVTTPGS